MKIVCDACQAKYSISDDKVQGKVFKIRCKKCSNIIVVRGGGGGAAEAAPAAGEKDTRVYDYGHDGGDAAPAADDAVWHVVINQDQVGPLTAVEVEQKFASGEIDAETYAWREGFADWLPLAQVDAFASLVAGGGSASDSGGGASAVSSMFGGSGSDEAGTVRSDPGDLFATASKNAAAKSDDDGDLFGSKPKKAAAAAPAAAASGGGDASKLRGERNENSVLFSLNNLAQLASDKPAPSASVSTVPSGHATGAAGGEGSGLIDIRSMANAYMGGPGTASSNKPATASAGIGSIDDLPVFGGGGFSEPAVIVPVAQRSSGNNKMMFALIGAVGLLAVVAVIMVVVLLKGGDDKKEKVAAAGSTEESSDKDKDKDKGKDEKPSDDKATETVGSKPEDTKPSDTKPEDTKPTDTKPADTVAKTDEKKPSSSDKKPSSSDKKPSSSDKKPSSSEKPSGTTTVAAKPAETAKPAGGGDSGGCDEVSCVLNNYEGACCSKFKKGGSKPSGGTKPPGGGDLPDALDRGMIQAGVDKVKARVMACGDRSSAKGEVKVSVKVAANGSVASVTVKNTPDAGLGSCVAGAMQKATFAKTSNGGSFAYPWKF